MSMDDAADSNCPALLLLYQDYKIPISSLGCLLYACVLYAWLYVELYPEEVCR
jgi:hypothetical protein